MSAPTLNLLDGFLKELDKEADKDLPADPYDQHESSPEVRAQRAATIIRNARGHECLMSVIRKALLSKPSLFPPQTAALAAIQWPLIVSTNYDDLLFGACYTNAVNRIKPCLLGRSVVDCKHVVSALSSPFDRDYIWHIQGFLGGQHKEWEQWMKELRENGRAQEFERELVIGHCEYRRAATAAVHFRRCFGEVYRSHSFLFLGSSLSEAYFLSLFGEVLDLVGPSPVPHFAFVKKGEVNPHFLSGQMNITVCAYENHCELPGWLERLKGEIDRPKACAVRWCSRVTSSEDLQVSADSAPALADIPEGEALAVIAACGQHGTPDFSTRSDAPTFDKIFDGAAFEEGKHVLRAECENVFAVSGRAFGLGDEQAAIWTAAEQLFDQVTKCKFRAFHLTFPFQGLSVPPVYGFMEAVRTFGCWKRSHPGNDLRANLYVGPHVVLNLTSLRIDLQELLTSDLVRFWTVVSADVNAEPSRRGFHCPPNTCFKNLLEEVGVPASDDWQVLVRPSPSLDDRPVGAGAISEQSLIHAGIVFGSVVAIHRVGATECKRSATAS